MSLFYQDNGNLIPGIHELTWPAFKQEFGHNKHRLKLLGGIERIMSELKIVGCKTLYVGGSFPSKKINPSDFDACWDPSGVDIKKLLDLYPILLDFTPDTKKQKDEYGGELFPSPRFLNFFQKDRDGLPKGIIKLTI